MSNKMKRFCLLNMICCFKTRVTESFSFKLHSINDGLVSQTMKRYPMLLLGFLLYFCTSARPVFKQRVSCFSI
ncbi:hypothetical protein XELAEV_18006747mg [Xenopus laevis]|uniref:Uncharacterized protein n=1 Tax=Xenopus laevis TaxID=8355 RepID=A0A974I4P3_XENLA|nr:hypothetical protein XELAEV_18006747mg [Xenopus laevis]